MRSCLVIEKNFIFLFVCYSSSEAQPVKEELPLNQESKIAIETADEPVSSSQDKLTEKENIPEEPKMRTRQSLRNAPKAQTEEELVSEKNAEKKDETISRSVAGEKVEKEEVRRRSKRQSTRGKSDKQEENLSEIQETVQEVAVQEVTVQEKVEEKRRRSQPAQNARQEKEAGDQKKRRSTRASRKSEQIDPEIASQGSQESAPTTDAESVSEQVVVDEAEEGQNNVEEQKPEENVEPTQEKPTDKRRSTRNAKQDVDKKRRSTRASRRSELKDVDQEREAVSKEEEDKGNKEHDRTNTEGDTNTTVGQKSDEHALSEERQPEDMKDEAVEGDHERSEPTKVSDSQNDATNQPNISKTVPEKEGASDHGIEDEEDGFLSLKVTKKLPKDLLMDIDDDDDLEVLDVESQEWGMPEHEDKAVDDKQKKKSVHNKKNRNKD